MSSIDDMDPLFGLESFIICVGQGHSLIRRGNKILQKLGEQSAELGFFEIYKKIQVIVRYWLDSVFSFR